MGVTAMDTHPALGSTATLNIVLGGTNLVITFLLCVMIGASLGFVPVDSPVVVLVCGGLLLVFVAPGICLMCCAAPIRFGSKTAVTVALVVSSLTVLIYAVGLFQGIVRIVRYLRWFGDFPPAGAVTFLVINATLFTAFVINVIKLARCYGVINQIGYSGRRGFEPLMPTQQMHPPQPPPNDQWPDITG
jgi:hypothetical protein